MCLEGGEKEGWRLKIVYVNTIHCMLQEEGEVHCERYQADVRKCGNGPLFLLINFPKLQEVSFYIVRRLLGL